MITLSLLLLPLIIDAHFLTLINVDIIASPSFKTTASVIAYSTTSNQRFLLPSSQMECQSNNNDNHIPSSSQVFHNALLFPHNSTETPPLPFPILNSIHLSVQKKNQHTLGLYVISQSTKKTVNYTKCLLEKSSGSNYNKNNGDDGDDDKENNNNNKPLSITFSNAIHPRTLRVVWVDEEAIRLDRIDNDPLQMTLESSSDIDALLMEYAATQIPSNLNSELDSNLGSNSDSIVPSRTESFISSLIEFETHPTR